MKKQVGRCAALYSRVSTADQCTATQQTELQRYAQARGFTIFREYTDSGVSGATKRRPALDRLMEDARKKRFDIVLVWRFDRFARSTKHLLEALEEFRHYGIDFVSYNENIDTSSPMGEAMFTIVGAVAKLERDIIRERVTAGVRRAMKTRETWGRRKVEQTDPKKAQLITKLRREGLSYHAIAEKLELSSRTVWRFLQRAEEASEAQSVVV
jgi:DNA invertase Pin-like site-specific DNA recombinase